MNLRGLFSCPGNAILVVRSLRMLRGSLCSTGALKTFGVTA